MWRFSNELEVTRKIKMREIVDDVALHNGWYVCGGINEI